MGRAVSLSLDHSRGQTASEMLARAKNAGPFAGIEDGISGVLESIV